MRPAAAHRMSDQRDQIQNLLTAKEFEAWDLINTRGYTQREAAYHLGISTGSLRDRLTSATRKTTGHAFLPFSAPLEAQPALSHRDNESRLAIVLLIQRDGPSCYLCKTTTIPGERSVEHIIPRSHGGTDEAENLALACTICNSKKGDKFVSIHVTSARPVYHPAR